MNKQLTYLQQEYLTIKQLAQCSAVSEDRILELIEMQCIPPHSYEISSITTISCQIREISPVEIVITRYYNASIKNWIINAEQLILQGLSLVEVASKIKADFEKDFHQAFDSMVTPGCQGFDNAWRYLMNGTWGICLKEISVQSMAKKELSRLKIAQLCKMDEPGHTLSEDEKQVLRQAVKDYESVTKAFSPYLIPTCSRTVEVEPAVAKYLT